MYKLQYKDKLAWEYIPATASWLLKLIYEHSCKNIIFSRMNFETKEAAASVASNFAECIVDYVMDQEKKRRRRDREASVLPFRVNKTKDGSSVSVEYFLREWTYLAVWDIVEDAGPYGRAQIVFLDEDGFRCTYEFDSLQDMFGCIKRDKYLAKNQKILLVADEGIPVYSSLMYQPERIPEDKRNKKQIRVVFRGEDGVRRTYDFATVEDLSETVRNDKDLNEKAEILLFANRGIAACSSLSPGKELRKKVGLKEIMNWFSDAAQKEG